MVVIVNHAVTGSTLFAGKRLCDVYRWEVAEMGRDGMPYSTDVRYTLRIDPNLKCPECTEILARHATHTIDARGNHTTTVHYRL